MGFTPWESTLPLRELVEAVESGRVRPCRALDVGCGTGTCVVWLAERGFVAHGVDISRVALRKAEARAAATGLVCQFFHRGAGALQGPGQAKTTGRPEGDGVPRDDERGVNPARSPLRRYQLPSQPAGAAAASSPVAGPRR